MKNPKLLSIVTPTYNRAHTLGRLYKSLLIQQSKTFDWVIIDDGSTDSTSDLVLKWIEDAPFEIKYITQSNAGKHVAINHGIESTSAEWVFIVDSDDCITDNAIFTVFDELMDSPTSTLGHCYRKAEIGGGLIGRPIPITDKSAEYMHPTVAGKFYAGDLAYIFRRAVMSSNKFPTFEGERFVPELFIWNKIGDQGNILFHHETVIYLAEYLAEGYSANFMKNLKKNPLGFGLYYRDQMRRETSVIPFVKCLIRSVQCFYYAKVRT